MEYKKIGNRYYKFEDDRVLKATYNDETKEYKVCGDMSLADFKAGKMTDTNTVDQFDNVKTELDKEIALKA